MPIQRLNHAVLYVRDVRRSAAFYTEVARLPGGGGDPGPGGVPAGGGLAPTTTTSACSQIGAAAGRRRRPAGPPWASTTWRGRSTRSPSSSRIGARWPRPGALVGASDHGSTKALYAKDPDGIEFEVSWLVPADAARQPDALEMKTLPLDLDAAIARYGEQTRGGVGVSVPV